MARKKKPKAKSRTIELDFGGVDLSAKAGGFHIPDGDYKMKVKSVEQDESQAGNDMFKWEFLGLEGKAKDKVFYFYTPLNTESLWKLGQTLTALGVEVPDGALDVDLDDLVDREAVGIVESEEWEGKDRSKLVGLVLEGEEGEGDGEEEAPDFDEMNEKQLKKFIKSEELDVDPDDHSSEKKLRKAVAEAYEEAQEEKKPKKDGKDKKSGKGGKKGKTKYTKEELDDMDEDELAEVVTKNELEVDLDDFKTPRKKVAAVIEALTENDQFDDE